MRKKTPETTRTAKSATEAKWQQEAVQHPGALRRYAERNYGLGKDEKFTIALLDKMLNDAEADKNTHRIRQINLAKTFVRQAREKKAEASVADLLLHRLAVAGVSARLVSANRH